MKTYIYRNDGKHKLEYVCKDKADLYDYIIVNRINEGESTITKNSTIAAMIDEISRCTNDYYATTTKPLYTVLVLSNSTYGREYDSESRDVIKCAYKYGRAEGGEKVYISNAYGQTLACAIWDVETRKYMKVDVSPFCEKEI